VTAFDNILLLFIAQFPKIPNVKKKTNFEIDMTATTTIPDLTKKTGALVTVPHAVKGKRGFVTRSNAEKRSALLAFRLKAADVIFVEAYCEKYGMTKTELLQRALTCYTGYDGKNAKQLLK
jgi:hypothetical protein